VSSLINILVTSVGKRVELLRYFKAELAGIGGKLVGADRDRMAPGLNFTDFSYVIPGIYDQDYLPRLLDICRKEQIKAVLSLIDPELSVLAHNRALFEQAGVCLVIPGAEAVEACYDKYATQALLMRRGMEHIKTYRGLDEFNDRSAAGEVAFPVVVKPSFGSSSQDVYIVQNHQDLVCLYNRVDRPIIQEFIAGRDYSADVYVDLVTKEPVAVFTKLKLSVTGGGADKALGVYEPVLEEFAVHMAQEFELLGPVDMDFFWSGNRLVLNEINPRFGGGYPLAHHSGLNFINLLINNLQGTANKTALGNYKPGVSMVKYDGYFFKNEPDCALICPESGESG